jgi:signal transduction histidine kinase
VVLTGFDDEALALQALEQGAQDYLVKGQTGGKLLARCLRYSVARTQAEEKLVRQLMKNLARVEALQRSRQHFIAAQEGARREAALRLRQDVRQGLLDVKARLQQGQAQTSFWSGPAQCLPELVGEVDRIISQGIDPISQQLYPSLLDRGLAPALSSLVALFDKDLAIEVEVDEELAQREAKDSGFIPMAVRLIAYRIAEEALTNAVRYAKATRATLRISLPSQGQVRIAVQDGGRPPAEGKVSQGLAAGLVEEYAGAVGGDWVVRSLPDGGTETVATLPLAGLESPLASEAR